MVISTLTYYFTPRRETLPDFIFASESLIVNFFLYKSEVFAVIDYHKKNMFYGLFYSFKYLFYCTKHVKKKRNYREGDKKKVAYLIM